jgi:hypothetical protein
MHPCPVDPPVEPCPAHPGMNPCPVDPPVEPCPAHPGQNPCPVDPGPGNPGPTNPGPTNPGPTNPGPTNPGPTDSPLTNPGTPPAALVAAADTGAGGTGAVAGSSSGPARVAVSVAGVRGPGGCVQRPFRVSVRGAKILRVDFALDGRHLQRATRRDASGLYRATISMRGLSRTTHRITARVAFQPGAAPRVRTLPVSFRRCAQAAAAPAFTG